ncbi:MAG: hypothetical protein ACREBW_01425 [Candidatus Micrarchaeaceae archaeon]
MVYAPIFFMLAAIEIISIALIFVFKDVLHSVLALSMAFFFNSVLFLALGQPLLALIQLFIMVGGVSTYIFVGVASIGYSNFRHTRFAALAALSVAAFLIFSYKMLSVQLPEAQANVFSMQSVGPAIAANVALFYVIIFMVFSIGLGSILLLKRIGVKR